MWLKYSDAPILNGEYWHRQQAGPRPDGYRSQFEKPCGCWITDDSENCWRSWCMGAQWGLGGLTHKHEVVMDESGILILRSAIELDIFSQEYGEAVWWGPPREPRKYRDWCIAWEQVAERYTGIIITPYQWSRRMELNWYYGWDCASGCIWSADAIKEIRLIEIDMDVAKPREAAA